MTDWYEEPGAEKFACPVLDWRRMEKSIRRPYPLSPSARKYHERSYAYYRCVGSDAYRFGGVRLCWNKQLRTDLADEAVWERKSADSSPIPSG